MLSNRAKGEGCCSLDPALGHSPPHTHTHTLPSCTISLVLNNNTVSKIEQIIFWIGSPQKTSMVHAVPEGPFSIHGTLPQAC